jgi:hypothetical protein
MYNSGGRNIIRVRSFYASTLLEGFDMPEQSNSSPILYLDITALYNREDILLPECSGLGVHCIQEIMAHPFHWAHLSERDTEEVLMEIYVARRRRAQ